MASDDEKGFTELRRYVEKTARAKSVREATKGKEDEARARLIATDRLLTNASVSELARSYGIGQKRVINALSLAERAGFYEEVEALVMGRLLPRSVAVYELHLEKGNLDAARDVMFGTGALRKNAELAVVAGGDSIESYRKLRNVTDRPVPPPDGGSPPANQRLRDGSDSPDLAPRSDASQED